MMGIRYPAACYSVLLDHRVHLSYERSIFERTVEYFKNRIEDFDDDYYQCLKEKCNLEHVYNRIKLFVFTHNAIRVHIKFRLLIHLIGGNDIR
jgi:hypothetical protein